MAKTPVSAVDSSYPQMSSVKISEWRTKMLDWMASVEKAQTVSSSFRSSVTPSGRAVPNGLPMSMSRALISSSRQSGKSLMQSKMVREIWEEMMIHADDPLNLYHKDKDYERYVVKVWNKGVSYRSDDINVGRWAILVAKASLRNAVGCAKAKSIYRDSDLIIVQDTKTNRCWQIKPGPNEIEESQDLRFEYP